MSDSRISLRTKLLVAFLLLSLTPTVLMTVFVGWSLSSFPDFLTGSMDAETKQSVEIEMRLLAWTLGLLSLTLVLVIVGLVLIVTRRILKRLANPILELTGAMSDFEAGSAPELDVGASGEAGELARHFLTMADTIKNLQSSLSQFKEKVESVSFEDGGAGDEGDADKPRQLKEALKGLRELDRDADDVLALVRHELKTPLTSISASTEALLSDIPFDSEKRERILHIILDEAGRLTRLVNDMVAISRVEGGEVPLRLAPVDLPELVGSVVFSYQSQSQAKKIALEMLPAPKDEGIKTVSADPDQLTRLITNVLDNAIKFTPEGGRVTVGMDLVEDGPFARVFVEDTGPGIDAGRKEKVFERYGQLEVGEEKPEGEGLGLAIAKEIAERHGGRIWFDSMPGKGATFFFTLPLSNIKITPGSVP